MNEEYAFTELQKLSNESGLLLNTVKFAQYLHLNDDLNDQRSNFHYPKNKTLETVDLNLVNGDDECIYLCNNSLGLCPKTLRGYIDEEINKWQHCGVNGHDVGSRPWVHIDAFVTDQMAKIVGAKPIEVVVMNSLTVNLQLLMIMFYSPTPKRHKILFEHDCFPSDFTAMESQIQYHGFDPKTSMRPLKPGNGQLYRTEDILEVIEKEGDSIAMLMMGGMHYRTGQFFEIEKITAAAKKKGIKVGWDLAHAAGNVELKLHEWDVDFACWCSYKYLSSGPGGIGGAFLHERYAYEKNLKKLNGWWGIELKERFTMNNENLPKVAGARSLALSNPNVFATVSLLSSLEIYDKVGMERFVKKQKLLTGYMEHLIETTFPPSPAQISIEIITPKNTKERGCQLSLQFSQNADKIFEEITKRGVVCDYRQPGTMRVAPSPLVNTFIEVYNFVQLLKDSVIACQK